MKVSKIINANVIDVTSGDIQLSTLYIGDGEIKDIKPQNGKVTGDGLDLDSAYLSPGFIDTHSHLVMYSNFRHQLNCSPESVTSIKEMIQKFQSQKEQLLRDGWLRGYSYNEFELQEKRHPNRFDLDEISTDIPIYVQHASAHMGAVNTKALELMGVDLDDPDPKGGRYERDEKGQVNGVLFEFPALDKAKKVLPNIEPESLAEDIEAGIKDYQSRGFTSATEMCIGILSGMDDYHAVLNYLERPQHFRTRYALDYKLLLEEAEFKDMTGEALDEKFSSLSGGFARLGGAKFFNDGSIQIHTAAIRGEYYDGAPSDDTQFTDDELIELFIHFQKRGYPLITHANGDLAAEKVINAYIQTKDLKRTNIMNRVEHLQLVNENDIDMMIQNDIGGSFFTNHIYYFGDIHKKKFLGPERVKTLDPVRWAVDKGMISTIHSDCPVTDVSPLGSIKIASDRTTRNGDVLGEEMKLSRLEAYRKMTIDAAVLNGTGAVEGSIDIGKYADFAVLKENPLDEKTELNDSLVTMTIVDGRVVYED
ncbi:amidohydrolase [Corticicoccus populi]|uniref:Amidohydrolase n=1 Tax=Corticicoccus populi TaxID=1812821 RepID=A0ABW5WT05_9STAP